MRRTLVALGAVAAFFVAGIASAQTASTTASSSPAVAVTFPIAELGNCASREACKTYCDIESHRDACLAYAEAHGLMKKEDTDKARIVIKATGPGGCKGVACKTYCADTTHQDECVAFAAERGLLNAAQKSVVQDIKQNGGPGGCTSPVSCREYCSDTAHVAECRAFAESHGIKPQSGLLMKNPNAAERTASTSDAKKAAIDAILAKTAGPGGCTTAETCRTYCADKTHQAECAAFAKANGLIENGQPVRMGSTTPRKDGRGTTTIPSNLRQKLDGLRASSTEMKRGKVIPLDPVRPQPTDAAGEGADDAGAGAPPAGGAGVLWGILNFFVGRR